MKPYQLLIAAALLVGGFLIFRYFGSRGTPSHQPSGAGEIITSYRNVPIRSNGPDYTTSHGKHYSEEGYYYGQKWQCVEFVKRFYHDAFGHRMPSVWGHAKDFFDSEVPHGALNPERGMLQFVNGGTTCPQPDDLLVFDFAPFGHVAIVCEVRNGEVTVIQQNVAGRPKESHPLEKRGRFFIVGSKRKPAGWLRLPPSGQAEPAAIPPREPAP